MARRLPRRSRVDTGDNLSILWMEHRWSSDGSKDNPTRLNPPPSPAIMPHVCHFISFHAGHVRAYAKTFFDKRARITKRPTKRVIAATPPFRWPFAVRGRRCRTGSWSARKARASSNPEQPTHSCFSHVLPRFVWRRRCFDVVVLQIDERDNRCEAKKLAKETLKLRQLDSQSVRNFFPIPFDFFFFFPLSTWNSNWKFRRSKPLKLGSVDLENSIFDEMVLLGFFFFWKFFWKENFWNIERISFLGKVFLENLKSWIEKWWI